MDPRFRWCTQIIREIQDPEQTRRRADCVQFHPRILHLRGMTSSSLLSLFWIDVDRSKTLQKSDRQSRGAAAERSSFSLRMLCIRLDLGLHRDCDPDQGVCSATREKVEPDPVRFCEDNGPICLAREPIAIPAPSLSALWELTVDPSNAHHWIAVPSNGTDRYAHR